MTRELIIWASMTPRERVTLHIYPAVCLIVGSDWILTSTDLLSLSPTFEISTIGWMTMTGWGCILFVIGLGFILSLMTGKGYWVILSVLCGVLGVMTSICVMAYVSGQSSFSIGVWPASLSAFCWASIRGLTSTQATQTQEDTSE